MTTHTQHCLDETARCNREITIYDATWPNYCRTCNGNGGHMWYENQSPLGSGLNWPEQMGEPCDDCLGVGKCPRCGHQHGENWNSDNEELCQMCLFNPYTGDSRPGQHECYCWEYDCYDWHNLYDESEQEAT